MSDGLILFMGISVFTLMLIGIVLTVTEFRKLGRREKRRKVMGPE